MTTAIADKFNLCSCCDRAIGAPSPNDPIVLIDQCGCIMPESHLIREIIITSIAQNVIHFFEGEDFTFEVFQCRGAGSKVARMFRKGDVIGQTRYTELWETAQRRPDATLQELSGCEHRLVAFAPIGLAKVYNKIDRQKSKAKWGLAENQTWEAFATEYRGMKRRVEVNGDPDKERAIFQQMETYRNCQIKTWDLLIKTYEGRQPHYPEESWGVGTAILFGVRAVYHTAMAILFEYTLWIIKEVDLMSDHNYDRWRERNVTRRLAEVIVQYQGMRYDYSRPETIEKQFWKSISQT